MLIIITCYHYRYPMDFHKLNANKNKYNDDCMNIYKYANIIKNISLIVIEKL